MNKIIVTFVIFIFISFNIFIFLNKDKNFVIINNGESKIKIYTEYAISDEEKKNGLMGRDKLRNNESMLFVYNKEGNYAFWMKNMLINLDILFINKDFKIIDIFKNVSPCLEKNDKYCDRYSSKEKAQYVLETKSNFTDKNNIKIGDTIKFNLNYN